MKNKITDNYFEFDNVNDLVIKLDKMYNKDFFNKFGFHKKKSGCSNYNCPNKAEYFLVIPFFYKIKRMFTFDFNYKNRQVKSCKKCLKDYCQSLNTKKEWWLKDDKI